MGEFCSITSSAFIGFYHIIHMQRFLSSFVFVFVLVCQLAFLFSCNNPSNTVTDIDGNVYQTVQIGTQVWIKENLKTTRYRNGDLIPTNLSDTDWENATTGACDIYDNKPENDKTYGKLYNWYAVIDSRNLCPVGWHIPSDAEWTTLENFLGGDGIAGGKMKAVSNLWQSPNKAATNESGFSGLPGGCRGNDVSSYDAIGGYGYWWSSTEYSTADAWYRYLNYNGGSSDRLDYNKRNGFSVRCLRD
jgi:uncharacterized protein (TIGR02145 family)